MIVQGKIVATGPLWQCEEAVDFHTLHGGLAGLPGPRGAGPRIALLGDCKATDSMSCFKTEAWREFQGGV